MASSRMTTKVTFRFRSCSLLLYVVLLSSHSGHGQPRKEEKFCLYPASWTECVLRSLFSVRNFAPIVSLQLVPLQGTNPPHLFKCLPDRHHYLLILFLPCLLFLSFPSFLLHSPLLHPACLLLSVPLPPPPPPPRRAFESPPLRLILPLFNTNHPLSGPYLHTRPSCCLMVNTPSHDPLSSRLFNHNGDSISQAQGTQRRASLLPSSQQGSQPYPPPAITDSNHHYDGSLNTGREASSFSRAPTIRPPSSRFQLHQVDNDDISSNNIDGDGNNEGEDDYDDEDEDDAASAMQPILQTKTSGRSRPVKRSSTKGMSLCAGVLPFYLQKILFVFSSPE